jgi:hypothetical protein
MHSATGEVLPEAAFLLTFCANTTLAADDVNRWLRTEDFPEHFRLERTGD